MSGSFSDRCGFSPDRMYEYLTPGVRTNARAPEGFTGTAIPDGSFPVDRIFCLVGSNPEDYGVAHGLVSKTVGARSDGLVQIENAAVLNAHRAVVHRSHSGRYGIVNSEWRYQNLQRFLFGDWRSRFNSSVWMLAGTHLPMLTSNWMSGWLFGDCLC